MEDTHELLQGDSDKQQFFKFCKHCVPKSKKSLKPDGLEIAIADAFMFWCFVFVTSIRNIATDFEVTLPGDGTYVLEIHKLTNSIHQGISLYLSSKLPRRRQT